MPRVVKEVNLSSREARKRLLVRRKPHFRSLDEGLHLGYRKSKTSGAWVIRWYEGNGSYGTSNLPGRPDDVLVADGETVLSWNQAQHVARTEFQAKQREMQGLAPAKRGPYSVGDAMSDYMKSYERRGKAISSVRSVIDAHILPSLGSLELVRLNRRQIEEWHENLANAQLRLRTRRGETQKYRDSGDSDEAVRRRKSTANRILTVLKSALNHAYQQGSLRTDEAWRHVKPYREVDAARVRYLSDEESRRLVKACTPDFRQLVLAALLTGCRYGELISLRVSDFRPDSATIHVRLSKSGKPRSVFLSDEGKGFFAEAAARRATDELVFTRGEGQAWGKSHQQRPFVTACTAAELPNLTFHELRHTYASRMIMKGVSLQVVAAQLGHSDTRMVEKHYGHLAPSYIADAVREKFSPIGLILDPASVHPH